MLADEHAKQDVMTSGPTKAEAKYKKSVQRHTKSCASNGSRVLQPAEIESDIAERNKHEACTS